ncbi:vanadium-dependent haloperoxidase [Daejeonella oryzae]|uniref:vanadium-dependent haloperoxidase n=1 Tax=Daejeonella oryzae TaxID=1122943 RepID=UPI0004269CF1|nr:vanadium-dependent haloperoxidase [Daejeonella oryzae]
MHRFLLWIAGLCILFTACSKSDYKSFTSDPALYRVTVKKLNDIVLENNFPPVIASRNYAYANIAAYEVIAAGNPQKFHSLAGQIKHLTPVPKPVLPEIDFHFASLLAFCTVGNAVTFPEGSMDLYVEDLKERVKNAGMPSDVFKQSVEYADTVSKHIMNWSKGDNYLQTRSASKFTVKTEDGRWIPTPPMYSQALEPHWKEIRPMVLDSAAQIIPPAPPVYNMKDTTSQFYKNALEVKIIGDSLDEEQKHIADFWDDNPFRLNVIGHVMYATKKFSPGGHWMNIVGIATESQKSDFNTTVSIYTEASIALFDGFISCWHTKFTTNYVRPETVINKHLDSDWRTYLQTPPFPEYSSGHAVISSATAEILTARLGDNIAFRDTSEAEFGIADREFKSFRAAAAEAGMSRVYGGIHYTNSCLMGTEQGKQVAGIILSRLKLKKI